MRHDLNVENRYIDIGKEPNVSDHSADPSTSVSRMLDSRLLLHTMDKAAFKLSFYLC